MPLVNFTVPVDHWGELKKSEKINQYFDVARELRQLRNMRVNVIPIVVGALGTVC